MCELPLPVECTQQHSSATDLSWASALPLYRTFHAQLQLNFHVPILLLTSSLQCYTLFRRSLLNVEIRMATHKFRVGQKVQMIATFFDRHAPVGDYEIVLQLPESEGEFNYKIKSPHEPHQRMVKESQLRRS